MANFIVRIKKVKITTNIKYVGSGTTNAEKARVAARLGREVAKSRSVKSAGDLASEELLHSLADANNEGHFLIRRNPFGYPVGASYGTNGDRTPEESMEIILGGVDYDYISESDVRHALELMEDNPENSIIQSMFMDAYERSVERIFGKNE